MTFAWFLLTATAILGAVVGVLSFSVQMYLLNHERATAGLPPLNQVKAALSALRVFAYFKAIDEGHAKGKIDEADLAAAHAGALVLIGVASTLAFIVVLASVILAYVDS